MWIPADCIPCVPSHTHCTGTEPLKQSRDGEQSGRPALQHSISGDRQHTHKRVYNTYCMHEVKTQSAGSENTHKSMLHDTLYTDCTPVDLPYCTRPEDIQKSVFTMRDI